MTTCTVRQQHLSLLSVIICVYLSTICNCVDLKGNNSSVIKSIPLTIKVLENDSVVLPCYHKTNFDYVRWHKEDVLIVDSRQSDFSSSNRLYFWPNGSLQLKNIQLEDTGDYYCEIQTETHRDVQVHGIEVQYPPTIKTEPSGLLELPVGAQFEIVCEANGVPQPTIAWRYNGIILDDNFLIGNRRSYLMELKTRYMSGPFECIATNGVGEPVVSGVNLVVQFPPEIHVTNDVVYTKIGRHSELECIAEATPTADIHWFHYGVPVISGARINQYETETQNASKYYETKRHVLIIKNVHEADLGIYECRAENRLGLKSASVELTGRPMPCIFKLNPGIQSSTSHSLVWQTESFSPITEFKLNFRQVPSENITVQGQPTKVKWTEITIPSEISDGPIHSKSYTLYGLQPASVFEVTVLARNAFGWSDSSKIVRFATGGEVELPNSATESDVEYENIDQNLLEEIPYTSQTVIIPKRNRANFFFPNSLTNLGISVFILHFTNLNLNCLK